MSADPFTDAAAPAGDAITQAAAQAEQPQASTLPDKTIDRTARLASASQGGDIISNYYNLTKQYADDIRASGDAQVRIQAAAQDQAERLRGLYSMGAQAPSLDPTGVLGENLRAAADQTVREDLKSTAEYALEKRALSNIQNLAASGDYTQAKVQMDLIQHGDPEQVMNDINIKRLIINREVEKAGEDQPWFLHATDFIASTIGDISFKSSLDRGGNVDLDNSMKHWFDFMTSGSRQRREASELWSQDPATFAKTIREQVIPHIQRQASTFGYYNHSEALNLLSGLANTPAVWQTNAGDLANVAMVLPFAAIGKAASIPSIMIRAGARKELAASIADTTLATIRSGARAAEEGTGITVEEAIDNLTPSGIRPADPINTVPVTGDALSAIDRGQAFIQQIPELRDAYQAGRLSSDEYTAAVQKVRDGLTENFGRPLQDWKTVDTPTTTGTVVHGVEFSLGKKKGGGFSSASTARQQAVKWGLGDDIETVQDESGQWFVKVRKNIADSGFITNNLNPGLKNTGILGRIFLGARQIDDPGLAAEAHIGANARNKIMAGMRNEFGKTLSGLAPDEHAFLSEAMAWGENKGVWLTNDEIDELFSRMGAKKAPSQKVYDVYTAAQHVNDIEFALRNDVEWTRDASHGFETVSFKNGNVNADGLNGMVNHDPVLVPEGRVYDVSTGIHYTDGHNPLTIEHLKQMSDDGYSLVSLKDAQRLGDNTTVKHFLVKRAELKTDPLRRAQLSYRAGGHRMYTDRYFAKQAVHGVQPDTGESFLKPANTFISGTKAEVEHWVTIMEQARQLVKANADLSILDEVLAPLGHMDGEDFLKALDSGLIERDHPIEAMYDRELPSAYSQATTALKFYDPEESGFTGWLRTNGRMYYSSKGEVLKNWQGEVTRTVDPLEMTTKAMSNIADLASFSDYKLSAVKRWVNTYDQYLAYGHLPGGNNASDLSKFMEAKYSSNIDKMPMGAGPRLKQQMEAQRDIIRRNLGYRTEWDRQADRYQESMFNYVMGNDPNSTRHELGRLAQNWWHEKQPLNALRGLVFDMKMGFFNVAQFPLQIQTMLSTASLAGWEHAGPAFMNIPLMRRYLMGRESNEAFLDFAISKGLHTANGLTDYEYRTMMRSAKASGFFEIHNAHQFMADFGPNSVYGGVKGGLDQFARHGRFFFNEGEVWNRMMAWQVAYKEVVRTHEFPIAPTSNGPLNRTIMGDFNRKVYLKANDYSLSMAKESGAMWQKGLLAVPTQFWAYNARMLEAYFGKQFTGAQKTRLFLAQTFFYGAAGVPIAGVVSDLYKKSKGNAAPLDSIAGMIDRGGFDELAYHLTGADVAIGKRYGTGSWMSDLFGQLFGMSAYGDKSFAEVIGGSTYQILGDTEKTIKDVVRYTVAESGAPDHPLTREGWTRLAQNVSTVSYGMKAYMAARYHAYISNKGTVVATDLPSADAFYFALGMQPGQQGDIAAMSGWMKDRKNQVKEMSTFLSNQRARMVVEPQHRAEIEEETNAFMQLYPRDLQIKALKETQNRTPASLYDNLSLQHQKEKAQQEMINGQEQQPN